MQMHLLGRIEFPDRDEDCSASRWRRSYTARLAGGLLAEVLHEKDRIVEVERLLDDGYGLGPHAGAVDLKIARYVVGARRTDAATVQVAVDCERYPRRVPQWEDPIRSLRAAQSEGTVDVRGIYSSTGDELQVDAMVDRHRDNFLEYL